MTRFVRFDAKKSCTRQAFAACDIAGARPFLDDMLARLDALSVALDRPHVDASGRDAWVDAETNRAIVRCYPGALSFDRGEVAAVTFQAFESPGSFALGVDFSVTIDGPIASSWEHAVAYLAGCDEHDDCRTCPPLARDCWRARQGAT